MNKFLAILLLLNVFVWFLVIWQKQIKKLKSKLDKLKAEVGDYDR